MSVNELIATHLTCCLNEYLDITRAVVYNNNVFWIMEFRSHSVSNTKIANGVYTIFIGEV